MQQTAVFIFLLIFPLLALNTNASLTNSQPSTGSQILTRAENFLVNQYNKTIGLVSEYSGSKTYWLYSDNFLASLILKSANPSNITQASIAENISRTLSRYMAGIPEPLNQYMVLNSSVFAFNASSNYNVSYIDGANISVTLNNGTSNLNPNHYADIAFLEALYYNRIGEKGEAVSLFEVGAHAYNGIGINDSAFKTTYQTYKLALYIYAAEILGQNYSSSAETTLLDMRGNNGGFYTGYNASYFTAGTLTYVETTSLAILAISARNQSTTSETQNISSTSDVSTSASTTNQTISSIIVPSQVSVTSSSQTLSSESSSSSLNSTRSSSTTTVIPSTATNLSLDYFGFALVNVIVLIVVFVLVFKRRKKEVDGVRADEGSI